MRQTLLIRGAGWLSAVAVCVALVATTGLRLNHVANRITTDNEPVYLPKAEYLKPFALGWRNALADVLWFRTISYFGEHFRSNRSYPWLASMCELVTDLDPRAFHVYRFAGVILPWEAGQADAGVGILKKGVQQFPDSWLLHYFLGFNAFFFQNDNATALQHLKTAAALPGVHPSIARLAALLAGQEYGPEATVAFLNEMQRDVDSREVRDVVVEQMREAQLTADLARINEAAEHYRTQTGRVADSPQVLVESGLLAAVPIDPFGGVYELDPATAQARSTSGRTPSRLHQSKVRERVLQGEPVHGS